MEDLFALPKTYDSLKSGYRFKVKVKNYSTIGPGFTEENFNTLLNNLTSTDLKTRSITTGKINAAAIDMNLFDGTKFHY
jgi:hypothetical protein